MQNQAGLVEFTMIAGSAQYVAHQTDYFSFVAQMQLFFASMDSTLQRYRVASGFNHVESPLRDSNFGVGHDNSTKSQP
jgi:hypothetical protein